MASINIYPISDYASPPTGYELTNWTTSDGTNTNYYSFIDEEIASDSDYINNQAFYGVLEYGCLFNFSKIENLFDDVRINSIEIHLRCRYSASKLYATDVNSVFYIAGTIYNISIKRLLEDYVFSDVVLIITQNPSTNENFILSDINNLVFGIKAVMFNNDPGSLIISQLYITINYSSKISSISKLTGVQSITFGE